MGTLFEEMIEDLQSMNNEFGLPSFQWPIGGPAYPCIASVTQFKRDLVEGGFTLDQLITMTISRYNQFGQPVFPNDVIPSPQQKITFNGTIFRIDIVTPDSVYNHQDGVQTSPTGATIKIIGVSATRGI